MEGERRASVIELDRRPSFGAIIPPKSMQPPLPFITPSTTTLQPPKISVDANNEEEVHGKLSIPDDGNTACVVDNEKIKKKHVEVAFCCAFFIFVLFISFFFVFSLISTCFLILFFTNTWLCELF